MEQDVTVASIPRSGVLFPRTSRRQPILHSSGIVRVAQHSSRRAFIRPVKVINISVILANFAKWYFFVYLNPFYLFLNIRLSQSLLPIPQYFYILFWDTLNIFCFVKLLFDTRKIII